MFHFALKKAGMRAHRPPQRIAATAMMSSSGSCGIVLPNFSAKNVAPMAPAVIWPSAPMFQKCILKHGAMASAQPSSGMAILMVWRTNVFDPSEPSMIVP